jgi:hypothetical protein
MATLHLLLYLDIRGDYPAAKFVDYLRGPIELNAESPTSIHLTVFKLLVLTWILNQTLFPAPPT